MPIARTGNRTLHYETLGDGKPLLLVHGFTNFGLAWAPQFAALAAAGYRLIVPDLAGHGRSQPVTGPISVSDLAADLSALLDHLSVRSAVVCGLSLGGMVAQQLAVDYPARVEALVVACSTADATDPAFLAAVEQWIPVLEGRDGSLRRLEHAWPRLTNEAFRDSAAGRAVLSAWRETLAAVPGSSLANVARAFSGFDLRARLGGIRRPTLVISGETDGLFPPPAGRSIADGIDGADFLALQGAGHLANLDSPDTFNDAVIGFLKRLPA